jgi:endonuclease/exonuclease/phosphatase family metal-dependent hydrolase
MLRIPWRIVLGLALLFLPAAPLPAAESFRVATYNVENYLDVASGTRLVKSEQARAKVRESILALKPDVLALQEIGSTNALLELQRSLKACGVDLPDWEMVTGFDTNIHVAVLSRFPIIARRPQTNDYFLLNGTRFRVSRGFAEVDIRVSPQFSFTFITCHLKSRRPIPAADQADLRLEEAKILREKIDAHFAANPDVNLIVLGDFNDLRDSHPIRAIIGRGKKGLIDTRPAERNGDNQPQSDRRLGSRSIAWTHFYSQEDTYSRIDYILLSRGMARYWDSAGTYVLALPNWGAGSDHRPLVATFQAEKP